MALSPHARPRAAASVSGERGDLPASVDLRALGLDGPMKDQQMAPVCWSFAFSTVMDNGLRRAGRSETVSPLHLVAEDSYGALFREGAGRPTVGEASWSFDPHKACELLVDAPQFQGCLQAYGVRPNTWRDDPQLVVERSVADATGVFTIAAFQTLRSRPGDPDEIMKVIATGQAIYAEVEINMKAWSISNQPGAFIADWQPDGTGGHAVTISGYRTASGARQFLIHNSWGKSWADGGYAWMSEEMMRTRLRQAMVFTINSGAGGALPSLPFPVPAASALSFPFPFSIPTSVPTPARPGTLPVLPVPSFPLPQLPHQPGAPPALPQLPLPAR
jgi:hypothetical protein